MSCRRGYKKKNGKCVKETKKDFIFDNTKKLGRKALDIILIATVGAFTFLVADGIIGIVGFKNSTNIGKIVIGTIGVMVISFVGVKLRSKK